MTAMTFGVCQSELPWLATKSIVTDTDITRIPQEIGSLGAEAIRLTCLWLELDPDKNGKFALGKGAGAWARLDSCIESAEANGLDICLNIEPRRSPLPLGVSATPQNATAYGLLCGAVAQRYGDRIRWYEICNEVNSLAFFGSPKTPSKYVAFLRAAFTNITPHAPAAMVLAGALMGAVGTGWPTLNCVDWVRGFYDSDPQDYFHALSIHPYMTDQKFNQIPVSADANPFQNLNGVRALMDANGDSAKPIVITEWGFDSVRTVLGSTTQEQLEAEQALKLEQQWNIFQTYVDAGSIYPTVFIYNYRNQKSDQDALYSYGLVYTDYTKKRSWYFARSKGVSSDVDAPIGTAVASGLIPDVTIYEDPSRPIAHVGTATASGLLPEVIVPILAPAAESAASGLLPIVDYVTGVEVVSVGTGDRDFTDGDNDVTITITHDVTTPGDLWVALGVSSSNFKAWELYSPLTAVSDLDGALTREASTHIGSASVKHGSTHAFRLQNASVGFHTITIQVANADASTHFTSVAANSVLVRGANGVGNVVAQRSGAGGGTPHADIESVVDHLVLFIACAAHSMFGFNGTVLYTDGSTVDGNGDFILIGVAPGAPWVELSMSLMFSNYGVLAIDIPAA